MAHQITIRENGMAEMAYTGATPWHQLGHRIDHDADLATWAVAAGLDWTLKSAPVQFTNGQLRDYADFKVLYRSDSNAPLSVVGNNYKEVQPEKVLEFFRDLIDAGGYRMETAGSLRGGRRIWGLANTHLESQIVPNDNVKQYLLLATSCDGTLATTAQFTSVRVVCNNTLSMSLAVSEKDVEEKRAVKVRHSSVFSPDLVKSELEIAAGTFNQFVARMKRLAEIRVDRQQADQTIAALLTERRSETTQRAVRETHGYQTIMGLFEGNGKGANLEGVCGTAWGLLNAVTEYADFHSRSRNGDARLNSAWFGAGAALKHRAEDLIEQVA